MRVFLRLVPVAACLLILRAPLQAQEAPSRYVEDVRLEGVHALPPALVEAVLDTREPRCRSFLLAPFCALGAGWAERRAPLVPARVAGDTTTIRRLYADWGYPSARATFRVAARGLDGADVVFLVEEGAPLLVRSLSVRGLEGTGVAVPPLPLQVGHPYAPALVDAAQRALLSRLSEAARPFARVEVGGSVDDAAHAADVVLQVTPGPVGVFGRTVVTAAPPLSQAVALRRVAWREGQRFDPGALERTRERLRRLAVIDTALVEPTPHAPGDSVVDVAMRITAGRIAALQGAGSLSSSACLSGQAWWSTHYLAGKPREVTVAAGASNLLVSRLGGFPCLQGVTGAFADPDYFGRVDWREPVGADTWLLLSAGYARQSAPGAYIQRGVDGRIGLQRDLRPGLAVAASFAPSRTESTAGGPFFCALFNACGGARLDALQGLTTSAPLSLDLAWAPPAHAPVSIGPRSDLQAALQPLAPRRPRWLFAARGVFSGAGALTLSTVSFARAELSGTLTRLVGSRVELAGRVRLGALSDFGDTLPPQLRFFGGGPNGVRGAQQNMLGPRFLVADSSQLAALGCTPAPAACAGATLAPDRTLLRATGGDLLLESGLELRTWLSSSVQLATFLDYGRVRSGAAAGAPADLAPSAGLLSPGLGVRLLTPVGPLRVDLAYDPTRTVRMPLLEARADGTFLNIGEIVYDPYGGRGGGALTRLRRRLQLQLSLGQPF